MNGLTWQGQGPSNIPMESKPPPSNPDYGDRFFYEGSRLKVPNLDECLVRAGIPADRFQVTEGGGELRVSIKRRPDPPMISDEDWQARLDDSAEIHGTGHCYFIGAVGMGLVKIGYAANVKNRLNHMQVNSPVDLELLATAPGGAFRERAYHNRFREHRVRGEWFERHPDILAEIDRIAQRGQS